MRFFRKRSHASNDSQQPDIGESLAAKVLRWQELFARRINGSVSTVSIKRLKKMLFIFCVVGAGCSTYLVVDALTGKQDGKSILKIDQTAVPKYTDRFGDEINLGPDTNFQAEIKVIRAYVDSLQTNAKGKYDSLVHNRPGLLDSLRSLEEIYLSQPIK